MKEHPAANIFPRMSDCEMKALIADIREHGQREPIVLYGGAILDGRNRWQACQTLGIEPHTVEWNGYGGTPETFVASMNLHRRHLNESQRALIAARFANRVRGDTIAISNLVTWKGLKPDQSSFMTNAQAAELFDISADTVNNAKAVLRKATPEQIAAIERGELTVTRVARPKNSRRKPPSDVPLGKRGGNVDRIATGKIHAEVWSGLSRALHSLTSLPLASDVAEIARSNPKRTDYVDKKLERALAWLTDFQKAWASQEETDDGRIDHE